MQLISCTAMLNRLWKAHLGDASEPLQVCERLHQAHQELCIEWIFVHRSLKSVDGLLPILRDIVRDS